MRADDTVHGIRGVLYELRAMYRNATWAAPEHLPLSQRIGMTTAHNLIETYKADGIHGVVKAMTPNPFAPIVDEVTSKTPSDARSLTRTFVASGLDAASLLPAFKAPGVAKSPTRLVVGGGRTPAAPAVEATRGIPGLSFADDGFATWAKVAGDEKAFARIVQEADALHVTDIYRGSLPPGSGSQLLAEGLKAAGGIRSGQRLIFKNIINPETIAAYEAGASAGTSLLGRTGTKALGYLGLEATTFEFQIVRGKLDLIIGVK
jgi:hypothetical protein